jgi:hypothetical protein
MFSLLFRPKPKYRIDLLVERDSPAHPNCRYMIIRKRRFICPVGEFEKQWVYDGILLVVEKGKAGETGDIRYVTKIKSVPESHLRPVRGID